MRCSCAVRGCWSSSRRWPRSALRNCSRWGHPMTPARRYAIRHCLTCRIWPNSIDAHRPHADRAALWRMVRCRGGRATGLRTGAAPTHACGDGVAVAARRRRGQGGLRCTDGRSVARRAAAWRCRRHRQHRRRGRRFNRTSRAAPLARQPVQLATCRVSHGQKGITWNSGIRAWRVRPNGAVIRAGTPTATRPGTGCRR